MLTDIVFVLITSLGRLLPDVLASFSTSTADCLASGVTDFPGSTGPDLAIRGGFSAFAPPKNEAMPRCFMKPAACTRVTELKQNGLVAAGRKVQPHALIGLMK